VALDRFMESLRQLIEKINKDEEVRAYLQEIREFILDTKTGEHIHEEKYKKKSRELASHGRQLAQENKYANELNNFLNRANELLENIQNDEFVRVLRHHAGLVANDLTYVDTEGKVQVDLEMLGKLRSVIVPVLAESFKYIPIPRIEYSDENRHYWVDNIVLCGYDVIPENVRFQIESDTEISIRDIETKSSYTTLIITLQHIRTELKNLEFYYKRKTFPELTDSGRVTVCLGGNGATLTIIFRVEQNPTDKHPNLTHGEAHFHIHKLDIEFDKGSLSHSILIPMITNMFKKKIQSQIETEVEAKLGQFVQSIGDQLTEALVTINRPLLTGFDTVRGLIKETEVRQVYERRREKLE